MPHNRYYNSRVSQRPHGRQNSIQSQINTPKSGPTLPESGHGAGVGGSTATVTQPSGDSATSDQFDIERSIEKALERLLFSIIAFFDRHRALSVLAAWSLMLLMDNISILPVEWFFFMFYSLLVFVHAFGVSLNAFAFLSASVVAVNLIVFYCISYQITSFLSSVVVYALLVYSLHGLDSLGWSMAVCMILGRNGNSWCSSLPTALKRPIAAHCSSFGIFWALYHNISYFSRSVDRLCTLLGIGPPSPPQVSVKDITESSIHITWSFEKVSTGGKLQLPPIKKLASPEVRLQKYEIELNGSIITECDTSRDSIVISGINPGSTYRVRVLSFSPSHGKIPSPPILVRTMAQSIQSKNSNQQPPSKTYAQVSKSNNDDVESLMLQTEDSACSAVKVESLLDNLQSRTRENHSKIKQELQSLKKTSSGDEDVKAPSPKKSKKPKKQGSISRRNSTQTNGEPQKETREDSKPNKPDTKEDKSKISEKPNLKEQKHLFPSSNADAVAPEKSSGNLKPPTINHKQNTIKSDVDAVTTKIPKAFDTFKPQNSSKNENSRKKQSKKKNLAQSNPGEQSNNATETFVPKSKKRQKRSSFTKRDGAFSPKKQSQAQSAPAKKSDASSDDGFSKKNVVTKSFGKNEARNSWGPSSKPLKPSSVSPGVKLENKLNSDASKSETDLSSLNRTKSATDVSSLPFSNLHNGSESDLSYSALQRTLTSSPSPSAGYPATAASLLPRNLVPENLVPLHKRRPFLDVIPGSPSTAESSAFSILKDTDLAYPTPERLSFSWNAASSAASTSSISTNNIDLTKLIERRSVSPSTYMNSEVADSRPQKEMSRFHYHFARSKDSSSQTPSSPLWKSSQVYNSQLSSYHSPLSPGFISGSAAYSKLPSARPTPTVTSSTVFDFGNRTSDYQESKYPNCLTPMSNPLPTYSDQKLTNFNVATNSGNKNKINYWDVERTQGLFGYDNKSSNISLQQNRHSMGSGMDHRNGLRTPPGLNPSAPAFDISLNRSKRSSTGFSALSQ
ncbi:hypothetical protein H4219_001108 [Mycoemilia scoparia]|uniref:Fibronectin type-III domain-containing protein n=1 Tax=Mycoemilia scoparia TaxID=417184 RepID=A0A9W8DVS2_9FUNG|nr:hypothetical protein H4219_001108 [Mycoemilia scoparia]